MISSCKMKYKSNLPFILCVVLADQTVLAQQGMQLQGEMRLSLNCGSSLVFQTRAFPEFKESPQMSNISKTVLERYLELNSSGRFKMAS